jgi:hypothetical protein
MVEEDHLATWQILSPNQKMTIYTIQGIQHEDRTKEILDHQLNNYKKLVRQSKKEGKEEKNLTIGKLTDLSN